MMLYNDADQAPDLILFVYIPEKLWTTIVNVYSPKYHSRGL